MWRAPATRLPACIAEPCGCHKRLSAQTESGRRRSGALCALNVGEQRRETAEYQDAAGDQRFPRKLVGDEGGDRDYNHDLEREQPVIDEKPEQFAKNRVKHFHEYAS